MRFHNKSKVSINTEVVLSHSRSFCRGNSPRLRLSRVKPSVQLERRSERQPAPPRLSFQCVGWSGRRPSGRLVDGALQLDHFAAAVVGPRPGGKGEESDSDWLRRRRLAPGCSPVQVQQQVFLRGVVVPKRWVRVRLHLQLLLLGAPPRRHDNGGGVLPLLGIFPAEAEQLRRLLLKS